MQDLLSGYRRFRSQTWPEQRRLFETLAHKGQQPHTLVIACVDSRVDPSRLFDAAPGEMLVIRNVANLVPPYAPNADYHGTSAALEFGVKALRIPHIVVLGHGLCGGVRALLNGAPEDAQDFVPPWMSIAAAARTRAMAHPDEERQTCCEHEVVKTSLDNLRTYPWIDERVRNGDIRLHGAWFSVSNGKLMLLQQNGCFEEVES